MSKINKIRLLKYQSGELLTEQKTNANLNSTEAKINELVDGNNTHVDTTGGHKTQIEQNKNDIATNKANITSNDGEIATNKNNITTNTNNIATNTNNIAANTRTLGGIRSKDADIEKNTRDIAANKGNITTLQTNTSDLATMRRNITSNTTNIASNDTDIAAIKTKDTEIEAKANTNATNISTLLKRMGDLEAHVEQDTSTTANTIIIKTHLYDTTQEVEDEFNALVKLNQAYQTQLVPTTSASGIVLRVIDENDVTLKQTNLILLNLKNNEFDLIKSQTSLYKGKSYVIRYVKSLAIKDGDSDKTLRNIFVLDFGVIATGAVGYDDSQVRALIAANTNNITSNDRDIATNTSNITSNDQDIATNTSAIGTNRTNIANNTSAVATNRTNIGTNTGNITRNTNNIATNTSAVRTNTGNIATNTAAVATKIGYAELKDRLELGFTFDKTSTTNAIMATYDSNDKDSTFSVTLGTKDIWDELAKKARSSDVVSQIHLDEILDSGDAKIVFADSLSNWGAALSITNQKEFPDWVGSFANDDLISREGVLKEIDDHTNDNKTRAIYKMTSMASNLFWLNNLVGGASGGYKLSKFKIRYNKSAFADLKNLYQAEVAGLGPAAAIRGDYTQTFYRALSDVDEFDVSIETDSYEWKNYFPFVAQIVGGNQEPNILWNYKGRLTTQTYGTGSDAVTVTPANLKVKLKIEPVLDSDSSTVLDREKYKGLAGYFAVDFTTTILNKATLIDTIPRYLKTSEIPVVASGSGASVVTSKTGNITTYTVSATGQSPTQANIYPVAKNILKAGSNVTINFDDSNETATFAAANTGGGTPSDYADVKTKVEKNVTDIHKLEDQQYTLNIFGLDTHQTLEKESATTQTKFDDSWFSDYATTMKASGTTKATKITILKKTFAAIYYFLSKFKAHEFLSGYENADGSSGPANITAIIKEGVKAAFTDYYPTLKTNEVIWFKWNNLQNVNNPTGRWYNNTSSVARSLIYLTIQVRNNSNGENKDYGVFYDASKAQLFTSTRLFKYIDYANRKVEIPTFELWKKELEKIKFQEAQDHSALINLGFVVNTSQKYKDFSHATGESNTGAYDELERIKRTDPTITEDAITRYLLQNVTTGLRKHNRKFYLVENKVDDEKVVHFYEWNGNLPFGNIKNGSGTGGTSNTGDYWLQYWEQQGNNDKRWNVYTVAKKGDGTNNYDLTKALRVRITLDSNYRVFSNSNWPYDEDFDASSVRGFLSAIEPYYVRADKFKIYQTNPGGSGYFTLQEKFMKYDKTSNRHSDWKDFFTKAIHNINDELYGSGLVSNKLKKLKDYRTILGLDNEELDDDYFQTWLNNSDNVFEKFVSLVAKKMFESKIETFIVENQEGDTPNKWLNDNTSVFDAIDRSSDSALWKLKWDYDTANNRITIRAVSRTSSGSYNYRQGLVLTIIFDSSREYARHTTATNQNVTNDFTLPVTDYYWEAAEMPIVIDGVEQSLKTRLAASGGGGSPFDCRETMYVAGDDSSIDATGKTFRDYNVIKERRYDENNGAVNFNIINGTWGLPKGKWEVEFWFQFYDVYGAGVRIWWNDTSNYTVPSFVKRWAIDGPASFTKVDATIPITGKFLIEHNSNSNKSFKFKYIATSTRGSGLSHDLPGNLSALNSYQSWIKFRKYD